MAPALSRRLSAVNSSSSAFWMMTERPKVTEQRRQQIVAERAVEQPALQHVADRRHDRRHDDDGEQRIEPERVGGHQRDIGGEHDQVAVRDVDEAHHAEDQREPGGEHGVEPADQHALDDDVDPLHASQS